MKIAIDFSPLYSEHQYRGIGFYTKRLFEAMQPIAKKQEVELELVKSIDKLRFLQVDLIHYPYFSPFFPSLPSKPLVSSVVTIHDLIPVKYPQHFPAGVRGRWHWRQQKNRLKQVKAVITDSQIWRQQITEMTDFPKDKIFSIPLAAGEEFKLVKNRKVLTRVEKKYNLPGKFIFYVGDVNWNKNVNGLIKAFVEFKTSHEDFKLVLAGKAFKKRDLSETKTLVQLIKSFGLNQKIKFLGFVPTEDLVVIYNLASVYCQPSFDEGFGLSVLEAMACGCPVVAAKAGSLSEICGKAAIMVEPDKITAIATGIIKALAKRSELVEEGLKQVEKFTWQKTARETLAIYRKAVFNEKNN